MTTVSINGTDYNFLSRPSFKSFNTPTFYVARDSSDLRCAAHVSACTSCQFSKRHHRQSSCGAVVNNIVKTQYPEIFL